jgi:hypothetical protein
MKKIIAALATALLASTAFAQAAISESGTAETGNAQMKGNHETPDAKATAVTKKADASNGAAKAKYKAPVQVNTIKKTPAVAQTRTPLKASDVRASVAKQQTKAIKKRGAQATVHKQEVVTQGDANSTAPNEKVAVAKK